MLNINNVRKRVSGKLLILDLDEETLCYDKPGVYGILGANGSGKSTLMRIMSGVTPPSSGTVEIGSLSPPMLVLEADAQVNPSKPLIGYLSEESSILPELSVIDFLTTCASLVLAQISTPLNTKLLLNTTLLGSHKEVRRVIELCDLRQFQDTPCGKLSKGYKKRVSIAATLLYSPETIILDEPTSDIDLPFKAFFYNIIQTMSSSHIIIISSHLMEDIVELCGSTIILHKGLLVNKVDLEGMAKQSKEDLLLKSYGDAIGIESIASKYFSA